MGDYGGLMGLRQIRTAADSPYQKDLRSFSSPGPTDRGTTSVPDWHHYGTRGVKKCQPDYSLNSSTAVTHAGLQPPSDQGFYSFCVEN